MTGRLHAAQKRIPILIRNCLTGSEPWASEARQATHLSINQFGDGLLIARIGSERRDFPIGTKHQLIWLGADWHQRKNSTANRFPSRHPIAPTIASMKMATQIAMDATEQTNNGDWRRTNSSAGLF